VASADDSNRFKSDLLRAYVQVDARVAPLVWAVKVRTSVASYQCTMFSYQDVPVCHSLIDMDSSSQYRRCDPQQAAFVRLHADGHTVHAGTRALEYEGNVRPHIDLGCLVLCVTCSVVNHRSCLDISSSLTALSSVVSCQKFSADRLRSRYALDLQP